MMCYIYTDIFTLPWKVTMGAEMLFYGESTAGRSRGLKRKPGHPKAGRFDPFTWCSGRNDARSP